MNFILSFIPLRVRLWAVAVVAGLVLFFTALKRAEWSGRAKIQAKIDAANTKALQERAAIDEDLKSTPPERVRSDLSKWVR